MVEICPNDNTAPVTVNEKRWKRGEIHPETGKVFFQYHKDLRSGMHWVSQESWGKCKARVKERNATTEDKFWRRPGTVKKRKEWAIKNSAKMKLYYRSVYDKDPEKAKYRAKLHRERPDVKERRNSRAREKRKTDPLFSLKTSLRVGLCRALRRRNFRKMIPTAQALGCDWPTLAQHLESKFKEGMTWENRGLWHIDHIIPYQSARCAEDVVRLTHYTNLQPLWAEENLSKRHRMPDGSFA